MNIKKPTILYEFFRAIEFSYTQHMMFSRRWIFISRSSGPQRHGLRTQFHEDRPSC